MHKQQKSKKKKNNRATARIERNKRQRKQFLNILGRMSQEDQKEIFGKVFDVEKTKDFKDRAWTPENLRAFGEFLKEEEENRSQNEKSEKELQNDLDVFLNQQFVDEMKNSSNVIHSPN